MFPAQPNQSLIDGLSVLQALTAAATPVGSRQLARDLGLEPTRVNRLAKTLAALGFLRQTPDRKYMVGPGVHVLAAQSLHASGLLQVALPVLEGLHETGYTVALGVLWRNQVSYLYHGRRGMTAAEALGTTGLYPAASSGIGHVLLAALADAEIATRCPQEASTLLPALADVRSRGWAHVVRRERPVEATLAVPIGVAPYAALALAGTLTRGDAARLLPRLLDAARRIEAGDATLNAQLLT
jgi:DNA-binding IclR family transcriptional regulator